MEPLRPVLADSAVLTAINQGELQAGDFVTAGPGCNLTPSGRRTLIKAPSVPMMMRQRLPGSLALRA